MVNFTRNDTVWNKLMTMQILTRPLIEAQGNIELLGRYLDEQQIAAIQSISRESREISEVFTGVRSREEYLDLVDQYIPTMRLVQFRSVRLLSELIDVEHNDFSKLIGFLTEIVTQYGGSSPSMEFIAFHKLQLDDAHFQRIDISMTEFHYYEQWVLSELVYLDTDTNYNSEFWQKIELTSLVAQHLFGSIVLVLERPDYSPAFPILVDAFYEAVANLNFLIDENGTQSDLIIKPPLSIETSGYGEGRLEGETDEDVDQFLQDIRELRQREA